jgi:dTDP-L-rhamnose 4-epimerase
VIPVSRRVEDDPLVGRQPQAELDLFSQPLAIAPEQHVRTRKRPLVFEDGRQSRDFIDVRDVTRSCELALTTSGGDGLALNVGTGVATSVLEVANTLGRGLGIEIEPEIVEQFRAGDIRHCFADTRLAEEVLGFRSEIGFERGMRDLLEWLDGQEALDRVEMAREALAARGLAR